MTKLGFEEKQITDFKKAISLPLRHGAGHRPDRVGEDDHAVLGAAELNKTTRNISTAEDPSSTTCTGINQVQMHEDIGSNFATALRAFLRQDPNIIMVGEIRDFETAEIAVKAALTGHLVRRRLHTNDAPSTVSRSSTWASSRSWSPLGEPDLAQRLARRICPECRRGGAKTRRRAPRHGHVEGRTAARAKIFAAAAAARTARNTRLTRPHRALRVHALIGRAQGAGAPGRVDGRAQGRDDPAEHQRRFACRGSPRSSRATTTPEEVLRVSVADKRMSTPNLHQLLKAMLDMGASDLHITVNSAPALRIDGQLVPLGSSR
jgi:type II secretory ATPase GspE/PulE/Tfp pilus assembly ATPase PilB-like protein